MFTQCWYNAGPASHTVGQHCTGIGWMFRVCWDVSPWRSAWRVHDPVWNQRRYTGLNINSARPPLTWSSSHIERKETMKFIWKIQAGSTWLKPGSSASLARQSWALAMRHDPTTLSYVSQFCCRNLYHSKQQVVCETCRNYYYSPSSSVKQKYTRKVRRGEKSEFRTTLSRQW